MPRKHLYVVKGLCGKCSKACHVTFVLIRKTLKRYLYDLARKADRLSLPDSTGKAKDVLFTVDAMPLSV